ncbi:PaaI family thioesterase [Bacillus salitolerans]|uniref:PaaI family thioesterase n=1 Tax=Bacillus salitolerans TaxID=1437434 RepID=A0ABW4LKF4_9BACI
MEEVKGKIHEQVMEYLQYANEEEELVITQVLDGLLRKQRKENGSYLGGLLKASSSFDEKEQQLVMTIPNSYIIQNALNIVHGGITATLLDSAMGTLVHKILPEDMAAVTSEMKINYVAPGVGEDIKCVASIIHRGKKTFVCEGKVYRHDGKLMAHSTASFFIIPRRKSE